MDDSNENGSIFDMIERRSGTFAILVVLCILLVTAGALAVLNLPAAKHDGTTVDVTVMTGMTAKEIGVLLRNAGLIRNPQAFRLMSRLTGCSRHFKAGLHKIERGSTMGYIARRLTEPPEVPPDIRVTVIEGLSIRETASALKAQAGIDSTAFVTLAEDSVFAHTLGVDTGTLEGYLYPDTYYFRPETKPSVMIEKMAGQFMKVFDDTLKARADTLNMTVAEVVTLASIIECEATADDERPLISAVFHRRLKQNHPLEANPTIQYAIGDKRRILYEDLEIDSPYNTYRHTGLPPGPIASPGMKSIRAALYPAKTDFLYFVADGNGRHVFSRTITEHNEAIKDYRRAKKKAEQSK